MNIAVREKRSERSRFRLIIPSYPAFNIYTEIARVTTALGPLCIATAVSRMDGWDAEVIDENNFHANEFLLGKKVDHDRIQEFRAADVVGLYGGLTSTVPRLYSIAKSYKAKGALTIAGGQHFTGDNIEEALSNGIDYVVMGEGEETIVELLRAIGQGKPFEEIKGIAFRNDNGICRTGKREPLHCFDKFHLPDFSLVHYARIKLYPVERIRGCGMECEFCTVKGAPRPSTPERFMEQVQTLVETRKARHFFIVDDLFGQQREETIRLCRMLREYQEFTGKRLDFTVQIRLDKARDTELLSAMRKAGINTTAIGFESPIKEDLDSMNKHVRPEEMIAFARTYHRYGFLVHGMFIFGYPSEHQDETRINPLQRIKAYRRFIRKAKIDTIQVLLPVPLPGTLLRDRLHDQNRLYGLDDIGWEFYDGNFPVFEPDPPYTAEDIAFCSRKIMGSFYKFKHFLMVGLHIFSFTSLLFFLNNLDRGWKRWYRQWRNSVIRSGGWILMRGWATQFKKTSFPVRLQHARQCLKKAERVPVMVERT